jgi:hypothetical protein
MTFRWHSEIKVMGHLIRQDFAFEGMADRERVASWLDLLGRKVRVLLDEGAVAAT